MLPFLKRRNEASVSVTPDVIERKPDEGSEPFDMFDAVAEDLLLAIEKKDKTMLKDALAAFAEHLQTLDEQQDQEMKG